MKPTPEEVRFMEVLRESKPRTAPGALPMTITIRHRVSDDTYWWMSERGDDIEIIPVKRDGESFTQIT